MNNKIGDILVCKKDFYDKSILLFEIGKSYQIRHFEYTSDRTAKTIIVYFFNTETSLWYKHDYIVKNSEYRKWYIWEYFYTTAEWRDKQINSILND